MELLVPNHGFYFSSINIISMMIVKTALCVGNGTWLPQVLCRADDCIKGQIVEVG